MGRHKHVPHSTVSSRPATSGGMSVGIPGKAVMIPSTRLHALVNEVKPAPVGVALGMRRNFKVPLVTEPRAIFGSADYKKQQIVLSSSTKLMAPYKQQLGMGPERKTWKPPRLTAKQKEQKRPEQSLQVLPLSNSLDAMLGGSLQTLRHLDIGKDSSDALLVQVASGQVPQLETLICRYSKQLSDQGVLSLIGGMGDVPWDTHCALKYLDGMLQAPDAAQPCPSLQEIDISFCTGTTYVMTLALRRLMPQLRCIRRLPVWMTGEDITPFAKTGKRQEVHKYWADGSFSFSRAEPGESKGFVHMIQEGESGVVREALQYIDYSSEGEWPRFAEYCYRPGIAVKRADGSREEDTYAPSIYVWEPCQGMRAPANFESNGDKANVPSGQMAVVRRDGNKVVGADPDDENLGCLILSHMVVRPLPVGELMPPSNVVDANLRYILREEDPSLDELAAERLVHKDMGGISSDDAAWTKHLGS